MSYIFGFLVFLLVLDVYIMWYRNNEVRELRLNYISRIAKTFKEDNRLGRSWEWRFEVFDSVSYYEMLFKFCVPLDEFYEDKSFLDPEATDPKLRTSPAP